MYNIYRYILLYKAWPAKVEHIGTGAAAYKIYPNPASPKFRVNLNQVGAISGIAKFEVNNMPGQNIYTSNASVINAELMSEISLYPALPSGIYIVSVIVNNNIFQCKLVYQNKYD